MITKEIAKNAETLELIAELEQIEAEIKSEMIARPSLRVSKWIIFAELDRRKTGIASIVKSI